MEARLGADFSDVRVHTDGTARASAAEVRARAYTSGSHVVVGDGGADKHTLAHELTHVIQQRQGPVEGTDSGDGVRLSEPSDRDERAAEATARRALAGPVPVRRDQATVAGPRSGPAGGRAVQRTFQVVNTKWARNNIQSKEKVWAAKGVPNWTDDKKQEVWKRIQDMAESDQDFGRFGSYKDLVKKAEGSVNQAAAANLPAVTPGPINTGRYEQGSSAPAGDPSPEVKISRLGQLRRRLSLQAVSHSDFRNRERIVHNFRYKPYGRGESGDTFTIGHTGNFLLGGKGLEGHKYEDLFKNALRASGLNNQQAAQRLVNALTDATQDPFANLRPEGRQYLTKIVAIIQGSEFRRAAANPLAAIAAFNKVIATPGATLAAALAEATIFGKSEGGAKESQFHRIEQTPGQDFQDRAGAEYDAVAALLKVNGWDGQNEEQFYTTGEAVGVAAMNTFSSSFAGFMME